MTEERTGRNESPRMLLIDPPPPALDVPLGSPTRPTWRGRLHLIALWTVTPLLVALAIEARHGRARAAVIVYAAGLCLMLFVSTAYHRWVHSARARELWRRADHAAIFAAIAGTSSAIALTTLSTLLSIVVMSVIWGAAIFGAVAKLVAFQRADRLGGVMYIAMGWTGVLFVPALLGQGSVVAVSLLIAGGALYTSGALGFRRQWPTLRPSTFSYHEVWHAFTLAALGLHLAAVWTLAT